MGNPVDERPSRRSMRKRSNINVNFGDPGLVDGNQDVRFESTSTGAGVNLGIILIIHADPGPTFDMRLRREMRKRAGDRTFTHWRQLEAVLLAPIN